MDKRGFVKTFFTLSCVIIGIASLRANDHALFHAQSWLVNDKESQFEILSKPYDKGPKHFNSKAEKRAYQVGEALFRSPTLLGGQAAKARISCNSCHLSGGDNRHFLFPNISGAAGTADVSSSFFSSFRGNQNFDPINIPNLRKKGKIPVQNEEELRAFVRGLIVEEFNGKEPSDATLNALIIYLQRIAVQSKNDQNSNSSSYQKSQKISVRDPLRIINQSIENIQYISKHDDETAIMLIAAIRHQLGLIYERYQHTELKTLQGNILTVSHQLSSLRNMLDNNNIDNDKWLVQMDYWNKDFQKLSRALIKNERKSLYSTQQLKKAL